MKKGWENIPLVKLSKMLKQMVWFSGECGVDIDKSDYKQFGAIPRNIWISIEYRGHQIRIKCIWEVRKDLHHPLSAESYPDRFAIGVLEPYHNRFQKKRYWVDDTIKYKHSRYYSTAIDKIEDFIYDAQEVIDENIVNEEEEAKQIRGLKAAKERLCKSLDIKITCDDETLFYREYDDYCVHFILLENGFYEISQVGGKYTEAEIKKIIKIVGGNPRAIAERLSK